AEANLNVTEIVFRPMSEKPANGADQRFSSEWEMIHTSLSRSAHAFAISGSEAGHGLLPLRRALPLTKRRLLLGVTTGAIAFAAGFAAGRSLPSASIAAPVSIPAAVVADPELPAKITLSE